jgi:hypothetical protein
VRQQRGEFSIFRVGPRRRQRRSRLGTFKYSKLSGRELEMASQQAASLRESILSPENSFLKIILDRLTSVHCVASSAADFTSSSFQLFLKLVSV